MSSPESKMTKNFLTVTNIVNEGIKGSKISQLGLSKYLSQSLAQLETTSSGSPQAKSPAGSSAGAGASTAGAPGERTPTAHNKQLQNVKGQDHPPHPSVEEVVYERNRRN